MFSEEELGQVRVITPPNTLGGQGNPTASVQSGSSSQNMGGSQGTPLVQLPQQVHRNKMVDDIKLPMFKGTGLEDPGQHWFVCKEVWNVKEFIDEDIKMT